MQNSPTAPTASIGKNILAGLLTSIVAAVIMAVVVVVVFVVFLGTTVYYPVQLIGAILLGEGALVGFQMKAFLVGFVFHVSICLVWGIIWGLLATWCNINTTSKAFMFGILLGVLSMVDVYWFDPMLANALGLPDIWNREVPMFWDWAAHLVFGISFSFFPGIRRKLG